MLHRVSFWAALFLFAVVGAAYAQPSTSAPAARPAMVPGQIVAKQVTGKVSMILNGVTTELKNDSPVTQTATVITAKESSVILLFANGATTQLGADTTLAIDEFLQDPFQQTYDAASASEPTTSHTKLRLSKGELLGKVAHLKHDQGSYFTVETPVGAAGIRGTTFRIVFRPSGTGQVFAVFALSTVEGNVSFQQGGTSPQTQSPTTPGPQGQGAGPGQQPPGVPVIGGQEVVVTVSVDVNPVTGVVTVTAPPVVTSTQPISLQTQAQIVQQAQALATAAASTTFAPPAPTAPQSPGDNGQQPSQGDTNNGNQNSNSNPPANTNQPATNPSTNPTPPVTVTPPVLTPGAGLPRR